MVQGQADIGGGVEGHGLARSQDVDQVGIACPHGHGKASADDIPQDVKEHDVGPVFFVSPELLQLFQGRDDRPACTALAGEGTPCLGAEDAGKAGPDHILRRKGLSASDMVHDRMAGAGAEDSQHGGDSLLSRLPVRAGRIRPGLVPESRSDQRIGAQEPRGVGLGVTPDLQNGQALLREGRRYVGDRRGLADASFSVKCDFDHCSLLLLLMKIGQRPRGPAGSFSLISLQAGRSVSRIQLQAGRLLFRLPPAGSCPHSRIRE